MRNLVFSVLFLMFGSLSLQAQCGTNCLYTVSTFSNKSCTSGSFDWTTKVDICIRNFGVPDNRCIIDVTNTSSSTYFVELDVPATSQTFSYSLTAGQCKLSITSWAINDDVEIRVYDGSNFDCTAEFNVNCL